MTKKGYKLTEEHKRKIGITNSKRKHQPQEGFQKGYQEGKFDKLSAAWKGDDAGYMAIHIWVKKHKGKPIKCEHCGAVRDEKRFHWANIDHKYRRDIDDYISLCVSYHNKYDIKNNKKLKKQ